MMRGPQQASVSRAASIVLKANKLRGPSENIRGKQNKLKFGMSRI